MKHYIITNRGILSDPTGEYISEAGGEEASENLRFGLFDSTIFLNTNSARQSIELFPEPPEIPITAVLPVTPVPYSKASINSAAEELYGSARLFTMLYQEMSSDSGGDLLFFIHGYHNDLPGALKSVCELERRYINADSPIKHIVCFTWPSMHKLLRYRSDAKDAELSGFTLARCYLMLIDFFKTMFSKDPENPALKPCGHDIHLLAHSMGNRVVENMMIELLRQKGDNITALFKEVILAAADVDWQVFEDPRAFYSLVDICQRVTVYFNTCDLALFISETTKNAYNRLGKFGFRDSNKVPSHVYSVDCSGVRDDRGLENELVQHWYYKESPKVVNDITLVLKGKNVETFIDGLRVIVPGNPIQFRIKL